MKRARQAEARPTAPPKWLLVIAAMAVLVTLAFAATS
jgi:hypothetical protein